MSERCKSAVVESVVIDMRNMMRMRGVWRCGDHGDMRTATDRYAR